MIAEVYPLMRLPRKRHVFDYRLQEGQSAVRGSFVRIPYRSKTIWGIVRAVKDKPPRGITLKEVESVHPMTLREEELSFFERLAWDLAQSTASLLYNALPTPPRRGKSARVNPPLSWLPLTLSRKEAEHVLRIVHTLSARGKAFVQTPDLRRATAVILGYLQTHPDQKVLILAPTVRDVELLKTRLTGHEPYVITGAEPNNARFRTWNAFREANSGILLGTRTSLLMLDSEVTTVFLLRSGNVNHASRDRNPRFDARRVVWQHQAHFSTKVFSFDVAPSPHDLARFSDAERLNWGVYPDTHVVNLTQEQAVSEDRLTTYSVGSAIHSALESGQRVLAVYQRKGQHASLSCRDCGNRFLCPRCETPMRSGSHILHCGRCRHSEPMAMRCPVCNGSRISEFAFGNEHIAQTWKSLFPGASISVMDKEHPDDRLTDIQLVTSYYYENHYDPFRRADYGLVVHLDVDAPLYDADPTAMAEFSRDVWKWSWIGFSLKCPVVLQTASPDLLQSILNAPFVAAQEELSARYRYHLPPYYRWCEITLKESERRKAEISIEHLVKTLEAIEGSVLHPVAWNEHGYPVLTCGILESRFGDLSAVFTTLPDRYIIDTNLYGC